ncbi:class I SAM-dependent methyltransferase, partial [Nitrospinaceae bacterium]|nr:class I SAM-dependent methyltransferase [Nitrospinaceae bacterium]
MSKRISNPTRTLDVGCGVCILGLCLDGKQCEVTGWDLRLNHIEDYEEYYVSMEEGNVEKEGLGKEKYDAVIFSDVFEHLNNGGGSVQGKPRHFNCRGQSDSIPSQCCLFREPPQEFLWGIGITQM